MFKKKEETKEKKPDAIDLSPIAEIEKKVDEVIEGLKFLVARQEETIQGIQYLARQIEDLKEPEPIKEPKGWGQK